MVYVLFCFLVFGCQYQCSWLPGKTPSPKWPIMCWLGHYTLHTHLVQYCSLLTAQLFTMYYYSCIMFNAYVWPPHSALQIMYYVVFIPGSTRSTKSTTTENLWKVQYTRNFYNANKYNHWNNYYHTVAYYIMTLSANWLDLLLHKIFKVFLPCCCFQVCSTFWCTSWRFFN